MRFTAKPALLALLSLGAALPLATPALAQKDKDKPGEVKLTVNEGVRKGQAEAQKAFDKASKAMNGGQLTPANAPTVLAALNEAEAPLAAAEAAAKTNDELYVTQELRYRKDSVSNAARYVSDPAAANAASVQLVPVLDKLLANPSTPPASIGEYAFERAQIAYQTQKYQDALPLFQRAKTAGSTNAMLGVYIVDTKIKLRDYAGAAADMEPVITQMKAAGRKVPEAFYQVAIEQAYRSKSPLAVQYELRWNADYPDRKHWHDSLNRLMTRAYDMKEAKQRLDVWRLMRASNAMADEKEKRFYAEDALLAGSSREALAVIQTANTSDPEAAKILADAKARAASSTAPEAAATRAKAASDAQSALTAGNFAYGDGKFPLAVEMYKLAQTRGAPDKDALLISLGAAQAQAGDKAGAQASFQAVASQPRKDIAAYWLAYLATN